MVIIVYLEHLAVKHQTTSGISVLEKKKSPEKTMQKKKKTNKLAWWMLLRGSSHKRENHKQSQKHWPLWTTNQQHHPKTCKSNQTYRSPNNIPDDQKETTGSMHETKTCVAVKKWTEKNQSGKTLSKMHDNSNKEWKWNIKSKKTWSI